MVSENFTNPAAQWGKGERVGGIVLEEVQGSTIRDNVAAKNWNGIVLVRSDSNIIQRNNASHVDNWGIHLWRSSKNHVLDNDFSHAIRCEKEAHACDSAESSSRAARATTASTTIT